MCATYPGQPPPWTCHMAALRAGGGGGPARCRGRGCTGIVGSDLHCVSLLHSGGLGQVTWVPRHKHKHLVLGKDTDWRDEEDDAERDSVAALEGALLLVAAHGGAAGLARAQVHHTLSGCRPRLDKGGGRCPARQVQGEPGARPMELAVVSHH